MNAALVPCPPKSLLYPTDWISLTNPSSPPAMNHGTPAQFLCLPEQSVLSLRTVLLLLKWHHESELLPCLSFLSIPSCVAKPHIYFLFISILDTYLCISFQQSFNKWLYFIYLFLYVLSYFSSRSLTSVFLFLHGKPLLKQFLYNLMLSVVSLFPSKNCLIPYISVHLQNWNII